MYQAELKIKETQLQQAVKQMEEQKRIAQRLKIKLLTPRNHLQFIQEHGLLDDFVSAKISGDDVAAKWHLLEAAKSEIAQIEKETEEAKNKVGKPQNLFKP
jgi:hypothetical protein